MDLSKQDNFCEDQQTSATAAASTNVLDFHANGDDIMFRLFWNVLVTKATNGSALSISWETSDSESFVSYDTIFAKTVPAAALALGDWAVKDEPLPQGLKRFNRLKFQGEASKSGYPKVTAFLTTGRNKGQPFTQG